MPWSDGLNPATPAYQIAASANARVRVVAGPGTGKSFAMKRRVARLLENGVGPNAILPVTFTRVAAEDLHRELVGMQVPGCDELEGVTLHSLALRMLMRNHVLAATGRVPRPLNGFELEPMICDLMDAHNGKRPSIGLEWPTKPHGHVYNISNRDMPQAQLMQLSKPICSLGLDFMRPC